MAFPGYVVSHVIFPGGNKRRRGLQRRNVYCLRQKYVCSHTPPRKRSAYSGAESGSAAFSPSGRLRPSRAQVGVMESAVFERHDACGRLSPGAFGGAGYWVICDRCAGAPLLSRLSQADKKSEPRSGCFAALCDVQVDVYFTRLTYEPSRVSTSTLSPVLTKRGTRISAPVSRVAGLRVLVAVSPLMPGSV